MSSLGYSSVVQRFHTFYVVVQHALNILILHANFNNISDHDGLALLMSINPASNLRSAAV